jgi:hypothetical protein
MKKILLGVVFSLAASTAMSSELYIDQAGGSLTVDVLQESGLNRINKEDNPFNIEGNDINVSIVQSGDGNEADLELESGADSTTLVYSATGDYNTIIGQIFGGIGNSLDVAIVGSSNAITYCKDYTNSSCNGIIANTTTTTVALTGNDNQVNFALDSADSTNTINIGQNTPSDLNEFNLTQTSDNGYDVVTVDIDGDSNTTDITQNTTGGNNTIVMNMVGGNNVSTFTQTGAAGYNEITMDVDGNNNTFTFDQQTSIGYTYITGVVQGDSNSVTILQN